MLDMILDTKLQIFKTMKSICSSSRCGFRIATANMELYMGQCWQVRLWFQFGKMVPFLMQEWRCESTHEQAFSQHSVSIPWQIGSDLTLNTPMIQQPDHHQLMNTIPTTKTEANRYIYTCQGANGSEPVLHVVNEPFVLHLLRNEKASASF